MASIMKRGNTYSVRYSCKDHAGKPCKGWETFKTKAEAQAREMRGGEGTAGRHLPRARHHDGRGDAVQVELPFSPAERKWYSQELHPICGDGARTSSCRLSESGRCKTAAPATLSSSTPP